MRILNSCVVYKFQTVNPRCPPSQPHTFLLDCHSTRHSRNLVFLQNYELRSRSTECVLFPCFNALPDIFAVMNYSVLVDRSYFMFITVTHCSLQREKRVCVEWYAQRRRRMEAWRGHLPLCPFERGQRGRSCLFIGVGAGKFWRCKRCLPEFPQTCP